MNQRLAERIQDGRLRRQHRQLEPVLPEDQEFFGGYCAGKAETLLEKGVELYRAEDFIRDTSYSQTQQYAWTF